MATFLLTFLTIFGLWLVPTLLVKLALPFLNASAKRKREARVQADWDRAHPPTKGQPNAS